MNWNARYNDSLDCNIIWLMIIRAKMVKGGGKDGSY